MLGTVRLAVALAVEVFVVAYTGVVNFMIAFSAFAYAAFFDPVGLRITDAHGTGCYPVIFRVACAFLLERAVVIIHQDIAFFACTDVISLWFHGVVMAIVAFLAAQVIVLLVRFVVIAIEVDHIDIVIIANASFKFFIIGRVFLALGAFILIAELVIGAFLSAAQAFAIFAGHAVFADKGLAVFFARRAVAAGALGLAFRADTRLAIVALLVAAATMLGIFGEIDAFAVAQRVCVALDFFASDGAIRSFDVRFSATAYTGDCLVRIVWAVIYGDQFFVGASHA